MTKRRSKELKLARRLWPYIGQHRGLLFLIIGLGIAASLAEGIGIGLFLPLLQGLGGSQGANNGMLGRIMSDLFGSFPTDERVNILLACIVAAIALKSALTFGYGALTQWLYARVTHQLRSATLNQLMSVGYPFIQRARTGTLINTLSTATWQTGDATGTLINIIVTFVTAAVYVGLLLLISWKLTLAVALGMLLISLIGAALVRRGALLGRVLRRANASLAHRMLQSLNGMKVIRTFGREKYEQQRFEQASSRVSKILFRMGLLTRAIEPIYELLVVILLIGILGIGLRNPGNLPSLVVFIVLLYRLQPKIKQIDSARVALSAAGAAVEDVTTLLDVRGKPYARSGTLPCARLRDAIRYDNVSFTYAEHDPPALCDVSLRIAAGKTTALVGRSGSGKSTLISLLLRLYEPTSGEIYVDGVPLHRLEMAAWRRRIAVVSQDIYMFDASVRENIAYGRLDASDDEIIAAARLAHAHEFIAQLPQGYDTPMGERGVRLSGGQQQRIALARAIIRDPDILILDEATNALDTISEQLIQEALDTLNQDRTVIVIAHRLSTIQRAHHVAVFSEGCIVEQGEPSQLLRSNGLFARLHRLQYQDKLTHQPASIQ